MKITKGYGFVMTELLLFAIFMVSLFSDNTEMKVLIVGLGPIIIQTMGLLAGGFMGMNVTDNFVKGKYYNEALDKEKECVQKDS